MAVTRYLSDDQIGQFEKTGFVIISKMYSEAELAKISSWIDELVAAADSKGRQLSYFEDSRLEPGRRILSRVEKFVDAHKELDAVIRSTKLLGPVSELLGEPALLFKEKVNFKLPGAGGFEEHQDIQAGWDDYCQYFLTALITVDDSTIENGCIELAQGHHKQAMIGKRWEPMTGEVLKGIEFKHYPMEPGDVALFDCFVPHRSKPNHTNTQRRNLYLTYNRASEGDQREKYFADKRESYPPDNEREPGKVYAYRV